jgi:hypothetical protein
MDDNESRPVQQSSVDRPSQELPIDVSAPSSDENPSLATRLARRNWRGRRALLRAAGEIAVVVVGVLIAFALNAWWVERDARRTEQVHLRALSADFERNAGSLRVLVERQGRVEQASLNLLKLARTEPSAPPERVRAMLGPVFSSIRFEPVMGAYDALLNSAGLALISDDELRASLATFAARMSGRYTERYADELYFSLTREFAGQIRFADVLLADADSSASFASLLGDPKFQDHLAFRHSAEREVADEYGLFLKEAEAIIVHLRNQLRP